LETESHLPRKQRRTAQRLFEGLQTEGYRGAYDSVQRFVKLWKLDQKNTPAATKAFIPLAFPAGETCQFDWSEETVELGNIVRKIKVGHNVFAIVVKCLLWLILVKLRKWFWMPTTVPLPSLVVYPYEWFTIT